MKRRDFLSILGGAAAWPHLAGAQQRAAPVIGFLGAVSSTQTVRGFVQGLKDAGYVEGENVTIEYRWADNQLDRLPTLAADLVRKQVAVLVATGGAAPAIVAKAATATIPIVFTAPDDPVELGLVASLSRPGGNLTGVYFLVGELVPKRLELLRELMPAMTNVAVFVNPANSARAEAQAREAESAARRMGLRVRIFNAGTGSEINMAFATLARERPDALLVSPDPLYVVRRVQLATLAARHAIPTSFSNRDPVEAGGLVSYGPNITDAYRQAGAYVARILRGTKPEDLPVMQSSKLELVINAQTALMLGLTLPPQLLARADEVIE